LAGVTLHNWEQQGTLNLTEALTESCNPAFYEIGLKLDQLDPTHFDTQRFRAPIDPFLLALAGVALAKASSGLATRRRVRARSSAS